MPKRTRKNKKFPNISKAALGNKNALGSTNSGGRKSTYDKKMCKLIYKLALLGCTDKEIAVTLDISESAFIDWKKAPEVKEALFEGRDVADAEIATSLFRRGKGYRHKAVELKVVSDGDGMGSRVERVNVIKQYPPDTKAASLWLRNRRSKFWKERDSDDKPDDTPIVWNETKTYEK